jgi:hypothetical protein
MSMPGLCITHSFLKELTGLLLAALADCHAIVNRANFIKTILWPIYEMAYCLVLHMVTGSIAKVTLISSPNIGLK